MANLRELLKRYHMTQQEAARVVEVRRTSTISDWCTGKGRPDPTMITGYSQKLARSAKGKRRKNSPPFSEQEAQGEFEKALRAIPPPPAKPRAAAKVKSKATPVSLPLISDYVGRYDLDAAYCKSVDTPEFMEGYREGLGFLTFWEDQAALALANAIARSQLLDNTTRANTLSDPRNGELWMSDFINKQQIPRCAVDWLNSGSNLQACGFLTALKHLQPLNAVESPRVVIPGPRPPRGIRLVKARQEAITTT